MQFNEHDTQQIIGLIGKRLSGELSPAEEVLLVQWMAERGENKQLFEELIDPAYRLGQLQEMLNYRDADEALAGFMAKRKPAMRIRKNLFSKRFVGSAAAVAAITLSTWFYYTTLSSRVPRDLNRNAIQNDIAPGRNTATLTLPNGNTINLSDAKTGVIIDASSLTYNDGEELGISTESGPRRGGPEVSSETPQFPASGQARNGLAGAQGGKVMSVRTPRGGTYQVVLPDGSKVWLNAESKISFPSQFYGAERKIILEGEAYFEVSKLTRSSLRGGTTKQSHQDNRHEIDPVSRNASQNDERMPFIVESNGQRVEVLGTHFNINSYADEGSTKTTLLEGSVSVSAKLNPSMSRDNGKMATSTILKPNEQSVLMKDQQIRVKQVSAEEFIDWKNEEFVFRKENLRSVMRRVARWYDIEVIFAPGAASDVILSGYVSRKTKLSGILELIERTGQARIKIEGKKVIILPI